MRREWIGGALVAALVLGTAGPLAAQQSPASQPAIVDQGQPDQAPPPPPKRTKPARHARSQTAPATPADPDLDTDDQLAPSQLKQPMPAAVAEPTGPKRGTGHPAVHAATDAAGVAGAPAAPPSRPARPATVRAAAPGAQVVACAGAFSKDSSHLRLAMTYDSKNIVFTDVDAAGTKVPASVLFPNDPKRRLEVWWSNAAARNQTYLIVINGQSTWTAPDGMKLGLTLAQLEKLNRKPFKLKGFDKDGLATVSDWDDGVLASLPGGCKSGLSLRADPKASPDVVGALTADKEFSSSDPALRATKPVVSEILIGY